MSIRPVLRAVATTAKVATVVATGAATVYAVQKKREEDASAKAPTINNWQNRVNAGMAVHNTYFADGEKLSPHAPPAKQTKLQVEAEKKEKVAREADPVSGFLKSFLFAAAGGAGIRTYADMSEKGMPSIDEHGRAVIALGMTTDSSEALKLLKDPEVRARAAEHLVKTAEHEAKRQALSFLGKMARFEISPPAALAAVREVQRKAAEAVHEVKSAPEDVERACQASYRASLYSTIPEMAGMSAGSLMFGYGANMVLDRLGRKCYGAEIFSEYKAGKCKLTDIIPKANLAKNVTYLSGRTAVASLLISSAVGVFYRAGSEGVSFINDLGVAVAPMKDKVDWIKQQAERNKWADGPE